MWTPHTQHLSHSENDNIIGFPLIPFKNITKHNGQWGLTWDFHCQGQGLGFGYITKCRYFQSCDHFLSYCWIIIPHVHVNTGWVLPILNLFLQWLLCLPKQEAAKKICMLLVFLVHRVTNLTQQNLHNWRYTEREVLEVCTVRTQKVCMAMHSIETIWSCSDHLPCKW